MIYEAMPQLKFEVEGMRRAILHHLGIAGSQLGEALSAQIQQAVDNYPWEDKVKEIVNSALTGAIENHFKYGAGKQAVDRAIQEGFATIFKS